MYVDMTDVTILLTLYSVFLTQRPEFSLGHIITRYSVAWNRSVFPSHWEQMPSFTAAHHVLRGLVFPPGPARCFLSAHATLLQRFPSLALVGTPSPLFPLPSSALPPQGRGAPFSASLKSLGLRCVFSHN